ncbi:MAG: hypothetical protein Q8928_11310, partial [Bacteroidota bacterium]|nr:hypothetical protein [Bacteroidota bacterium]
MNTIRNSSSINTSIERWNIRKQAKYALSGIVWITAFLLSILNCQNSLAQGVGISETTITADNSAILELKSTQRGLLIPRMTTLQRTGILSPAAGLMVYDTDTKSFWYYEGGWKTMPTSSLGSGNQILGISADGTTNEYKTVNGTTNQITVTHAPGSITLSTPQDINPGASPTFAGLTLTTPLGITSGGTGASTVVDAKTNLGLEKVDNTSDLNKPISTATQTAINNEKNRAVGIENNLSNRINADSTNLVAEIANRGTAETSINTAITTEKTRAIGIENALSNRINTDSTNLVTAQTNLSAAITTEKNRAVGIENNLSNRINADSTNLV